LKLTDLAPQFLAVETPGKVHREVADLSEAQGVRFDCPACGGAHVVMVWFRDRGVIAEEPGPARWAVRGTGYHDLTLEPVVRARSGCGWRGWVRDGEIVNSPGLSPPICPRCGWQHTVRSELGHTVVPCPRCGATLEQPADPQESETLTSCPACGIGMVTQEHAAHIRGRMK